MLSYIDGLLRYFALSGRSSRTQYFTFMLVGTGLCLAAAWGDLQYFDVDARRYEYGPLFTFAVAFHAVPSVTVTIRRLHDSGRSGVWYVLSFIPLANVILLVWMFAPSEKRANAYGDRRRPGSVKPAHIPERRRPPSSIPRTVRMGKPVAGPAVIRYTEDGQQRFI